MNDPLFKPVSMTIGGKERQFDIDDPEMPKWVKDESLTSGGYPYKKKLDWDDYENEFEHLQLELVKVQRWQQETGARVIVLFEGRDAAGKGGTIRALTQNMNPRHARVVALPKPTDREQGEWYYQRYIQHFPTDGELVVFDRSWYNRAGVEPVMGFCSPTQHQTFLEDTPRFEKMLVDEGIYFFKFWLNVGREMQLKRFHDRRHNPLKLWKLSPIDLKALSKWEDYTAARDEMLAATHQDFAPWTIIRSNDKRRARLQVIRHFVNSLDYTAKKEKNIGEMDAKIIGQGGTFLANSGE